MKLCFHFTSLPLLLHCMLQQLLIESQQIPDTLPTYSRVLSTSVRPSFSRTKIGKCLDHHDKTTVNNYMPTPLSTHLRIFVFLVLFCFYQNFMEQLRTTRFKLSASPEALMHKQKWDWNGAREMLFSVHEQKALRFERESERWERRKRQGKGERKRSAKKQREEAIECHPVGTVFN